MDEGIEGVRIIKAFNAAAFIVSGFRKTNLKHQKLVTRTARKKNLSPLLNETIGAGVLLTLVWFGGRMILGGDENALSGEVFMTFIIVFSQFLRPVQNISKNISNMIKSIPFNTLAVPYLNPTFSNEIFELKVSRLDALGASVITSSRSRNF